MFSNSKFIFDQLAETFYRTGLYMSVCDTVGGKKASEIEKKSIKVLISILQKQSSSDAFINEILTIDDGKAEKYLDNCDGDWNDLNLEAVPMEIEKSILMVSENFEKEDVIFYKDILIAIGASVAQAYDEKDDMYLTGNVIVDTLTFTSNSRALYVRFLKFLNSFQQNKNAKYLYDYDDMFDEISISRLENRALSKISDAIGNAWNQAFPDDMKMTVQEYLQDNKS